MKKLKKVFAVLLTLAMVLGMSITSFAASATVTVNGLKEGTKVSYVKLIEPENSSTGWKFADGIGDIGMTLDEIIAATNEAGDGKINSALANLNLSGVETTGNFEAGANGTATLGAMETGLYAIKANDPTGEYVYSWMIAYVDFSGDSVAVTAKGASNQVNKTLVSEGEKSVAAGDQVKYQIEVNYPYFADTTTNKSFTITDTVENGTFVSIDAESRVALEGLGFTVPSDDELKGQNTMTISLSNYKSANAGDKVRIIYTVEAGAVSADKNLTNTVKSTVVTGTGSDETHETESKVILPSFDAEITKTDENSDAITAEAKFQLYVEAEDGSETLTLSDESTVKANPVGSEVATVSGKAKFSGLDAEKTYYVKETDAPDGYALETNAYKLEGAEAELKSDVTENNVRTITYGVKSQYNSIGFGDGMNFHDTNLSALPETGGIGTTIFTIGGCVIMIAAAALFFASRRKSAK